MIVRCAFHVHSHHSFDCFTSVQDLVEEAVAKGIGLLAITDHDVIGITEDEKRLIACNGLQYVQGCELSTDRGAHIIGLGVDAGVLQAGKDPRAIIDAIQRDGGHVLVPHPFKPNSGFVARHQGDKETLDYVLTRTMLVEAFNGDYGSSDDEVEETRRIAARYGLRVVSTSDAHKPWQLASNWTEYDACPAVLEDLAHLLRLEPSRLVVEEVQEQTGLSKCLGGLLKALWRTTAYQRVVAVVPFYFKSRVKNIFYEISRRRRRAR